MFSINLQSRQPISDQLYSRINQLISLGILKPGEQLPTVRSLACKLGINPNTVSKAYKTLEHDGILFTVVGKGSFIREDVNVSAQKKAVALEQLERALAQAFQDGVTVDDIDTVVKRIYHHGTEGGKSDA